MLSESLVLIYTRCLVIRYVIYFAICFCNNNNLFIEKGIYILEKSIITDIFFIILNCINLKKERKERIYDCKLGISKLKYSF